MKWRVVPESSLEDPDCRKSDQVVLLHVKRRLVDKRCLPIPDYGSSVDFEYHFCQDIVQIVEPTSSAKTC